MENDNRLTPRRWGTALTTIFSSSLVAALLALWGTLLGLLYRFGWLSAFDVSLDLFMPDTATELAYWGYLAALLLGSEIRQASSTAVWISLGYGSLTVLTFMLGIGWMLFRKRHEHRVEALEAKARSHFGLRVAAAAAAAFASVASIPWLVIALLTVIIWLPTPGYTVGKNAALQAISAYQRPTASAPRHCVALANGNGPLGSCTLVIAQSKQHIAYMDGTQVHVVPAQDVRVAWRLAQPSPKAP